MDIKTHGARFLVLAHMFAMKECARLTIDEKITIMAFVAERIILERVRRGSNARGLEKGRE